jgi:hypothetical protein
VRLSFYGPIFLCASLALAPLSGFDCLSDCTGGCSTTYAYCKTKYAECLGKCSSPGANGNSGAKPWGAIAYSRRDKGAGWSHGWNSEAKAKKVAMDNCSQRGSGCEVWAVFAGECGALAVDGKIVTWGTAFAKQNADRRAVAECAKAGGRNCVLEVSHCSK